MFMYYKTNCRISYCIINGIKFLLNKTINSLIVNRTEVTEKTSFNDISTSSRFHEQIHENKSFLEN